MADDTASSSPRITSSAEPSVPQEPATTPAKGAAKARGRPPTTDLKPYEDQIVRLFSIDDLPISDIARRINAEHGLDVSERTISRRLTAWNVPRKKIRTPVTDELRDRLSYHYNKNLTDAEISTNLRDEGFDIGSRNLVRLRQKLGMRRRSMFPEFREGPADDDEASGAIEGASAKSTTTSTKPPPKKRKKTKAAPPQNVALIPQITAFVEDYMSRFDGSHDFHHIKRVTGLTHLIYTEIKKEEFAVHRSEKGPELDLNVITLGALLHDVGDKKYLQPGQDANTLVLSTLLGFGAPEDLAIKVQRIVLGVSYSSEVKDPESVKALIVRYPELGVVQDADRLDAIGAVGIGRTFTFGGAKGAKDMGETIAHFEDKLIKLESMMKTGPGKRMAQERSQRLNIFKGWWEEELREAEGTLRGK